MMNINFNDLCNIGPKEEALFRGRSSEEIRELIAKSKYNQPYFPDADHVFPDAERVIF